MNSLRSKTYAQRGFGLARRSAVSLLVVVLVSGVALASLGTTSYASSKASLKSLVPASIRSTGKLTDMVNSPYAPMEYQKTPGGPIVGFDIDIATALAKELGLSLVVSNTPNFSELIPAVQTNRVDISDSSVHDTTQRESSIHFVDDFSSGIQFMGLKSKTAKLTTHADLCGDTVMVQAGTNYAAKIAEFSKSICPAGKPIATLGAASPPDEVQQIQIGRAIAIAEGPESNGYLELTQPGKWHLIGKSWDLFKYGIMFKKNDAQLGIALRDALTVLIQNGTYKQILTKWDLSGDGVTSATIDNGN